ncbi:hypothetical protein TPDSL_18040 [Terrisporobacter petrolearius]|uniref:hypothetical protein n=1 Tax=Terrisporobacter petrolearius TaxID=1460447 RepID=UPI0033688F34
MSEVFRLQASIDVDTQQATTSLQQVSQQGQQTESRFATIGSGLQKVGATMTVVGAGVTAGMAKIIGTSKEWEATVAQQEFLYKNLDSSVQNFINTGAKQAESLGMTQQQYENNATALSNTLGLLGVSNSTIADNGTKWMNLCADMGAFADVPIDTALSDMKSALVGNFNALDKYGMSVNVATINSGEYAKSLGKTWNQMSNAEKAQAIMAEAMRQGSTMTGLAGQEAEQFGMKWNLCKQKMMETVAEIGTKLLPILVPLVEKIGEIAQKVADWASKHPELARTILLVVGAIGLLMVIVGPILGFIGTLMTIIPAVMALGAPVIGIIAAVTFGIMALVGVGVALVANWGTIKAKCSEVWNGIKTTIGNSVNTAKITVTNAWNAIKSFTSSAFGTVKSVASSIWNGIKSVISTVVNGIKSKVSSIWNGIKSITSSVFNSVKSAVTSIWNGIKSAIMNPIDTARSAVQKAMNAIKTAVNVLLKPKLKLPHINVSGKFSLNPPSVPKIGVDWYAKGGVMTRPTMFGMNGNRAMVGGEAGDEAILPLNPFYDTLDKKLNSLRTEGINYEKMTDSFIKALTKVDNDILLDGEMVGVQTASSVKRKNEENSLQNMRLRGELDYV